MIDTLTRRADTRFYNTYPGAACDVPSHLYSFSYAQRGDWSRLCSPQQEILDYQSPQEETTNMLTKLRLTVADAKTIAAAAEAHAKSQELSIPIALIDDSTYVPHLTPVGGAPYTSGQGAIEKAQAATAGEDSTTFFEEALNLVGSLR